MSNQWAARVIISHEDIRKQQRNTDIILECTSSNGLNMEQCPVYETTKVTQPLPLPPLTSSLWLYVY